MLQKIKKVTSRLVGKMSPRLFFTLAYVHNRRRIPHFNNPRDLSEIWINKVLKNHVKPFYYLADKYLVRDYVSSRGLGHLLTPLIAVYDSEKDIDFNKLPSQFALKMNYGAGMNIICSDKSLLDKKKARMNLKTWFGKARSYSYAESHYNLIERKAVCEEFIDDGCGGFPVDYKFMCIKGKVYCILACKGREGGHAEYLPYSKEWKPLYDFCKKPNVEVIPCPSNLGEMIVVAEKLSKGIDLVRVDLYSNGSDIWFGEMTLTPSGCIFHRWTQKALDDMGEYYLTQSRDAARQRNQLSEVPMKNKLCLIYNTAPRYREAIYRFIDREYDCDWYFGPTKTDIKEMDTSQLKRVSFFNTYGNACRMYWKRGIIRLLFKKEYQTFFMLAESRSLTDYLFLWLARRFFPKKKVYIWTHGWYGKESRIEGTLKLWMFRQVSGGIFLYGNYAKNLLVDKGFPEEKLFVIHNSLHYDQQKVLRERMVKSDIYASHFEEANPILIFIGRLTQVKRLDLLLDAMALLKSRGELYNLVLVGNGEARARLEEKVAEYGLQKNVWFYGACYDEKANAELIYNADLCVAPGNVGLTAIHSLMFGCPVTSHNDFKWQMPEFESIRPGITGDFFKRGDVHSIADVISHWFLEHKTRREEVRKACYEEIDERWNPYYQMDVIKKHLEV